MKTHPRRVPLRTTQLIHTLLHSFLCTFSQKTCSIAVIVESRHFNSNGNRNRTWPAVLVKNISGTPPVAFAWSIGLVLNALYSHSFSDIYLYINLGSIKCIYWNRNVVCHTHTHNQTMLSLCFCLIPCSSCHKVIKYCLKK